MSKKSKKHEAKKPTPSEPTPPLASPWDDERQASCSDEEWAVAIQVRELREAGEPWWSIGRKLQLEGWGDSATTGKRGAGRARTAYAKGFGSHPRSFVRGQGRSRSHPVERNPEVRALQRRTRAERVALAREGVAVLDLSLPDEDIAAMLKGHRIQWWIQGAHCPDGLSQEACVHPHAPLYIIGEGEERQVEFREEHRRAPVATRWMPAKIRTVRLSSIYGVRH